MEILELLDGILHGRHPQSVCITPEQLIERQSAAAPVPRPGAPAE